MVRVVWHVRGTAEHGITSLVHGERAYGCVQEQAGLPADRAIPIGPERRRPRDGTRDRRGAPDIQPSG